MNNAVMPADHKLVLAALLAVKHGYVSPDKAMQLLREAGDADGTIATVAPGSSLAREVERLASDSNAAREALTELGVVPQHQESLLSLNPPPELLHQTLVAIAPAPAPRAPAQVLPEGERYDVRHEHARGGMGRILVAFDRSIGREVALKELLASPTGSGSPFTPPSNTRDAMERFLREARVTGRLEHPNIVPVYEIGQRDDGSIFYTMKFVRGTTLASELKRVATLAEGGLAQRLRLLEPWQQACNAIAYAHSRGVIHRDIKPANIMQGDFGETLVLDWGLARLKDEAPETGGSRAITTGDDSAGLTMDGAVLGTPAYMPPEQALGQVASVDERSDIYALGAVLYEILTGRPPYEGKSGASVVQKVIDDAPRPVLEIAPDAPPELAALCAKAMARQRDQRPSSALDLVNEVRAFRDGRTLSVYQYSSLELLRRFAARHRAAVAASTLALLALLVLGTVTYFTIVGQRNRAQEAEQLAAIQRDQARRSANDAEQARRAALQETERARLSDREAQLRATRLMLVEGERLEGEGKWDEARRIYDECRKNFIALGESPALANLYSAYASLAGPALIRKLGEYSHKSGFYAKSAASSDGMYWAVCSKGELFVFGVAEQRYVLRTTIAGGTYSQPAFTSKDTLVLCIGNDLHAWNLATAKSVTTRLAGDLDNASCFGDRQGSCLVVLAGRALQLVNPQTYAVTHQSALTGPRAYDYAAVAPGGRVGLLIERTDRPDRAPPPLLFRTDGGQLTVAEAGLPDAQVVSAEFLDDDRVVLGTFTGKRILWDCQRRMVLQEYAAGQPVVSFAYRPRDGLLAVGHADGNVHFLSADSLAPSPRFPTLHAGELILLCRLSDTSDKIILWHRRRGFVAYDLATGTVEKPFPCQLGAASGLPLARGTRLVSGAEDGTVRLWNSSSGRLLAQASVSAGLGATPLGSSPSEDVVYVGAFPPEELKRQAALYAFKLPSLEVLWSQEVQSGKNVFSVSADGTQLLTLDAAGVPCYRDAATGAVLSRLSWPGSSPPQCGRFTLMGCVLGDTLTICTYQPQATQPHATSHPYQTTQAVVLLDISPDGQSAVLYGKWHSDLMLVETETGKATGMVRLERTGVASASFRSNSSLLVTTDNGDLAEFETVHGTLLWRQHTGLPDRRDIGRVSLPLRTSGSVLAAPTNCGQVWLYALPDRSSLRRPSLDIFWQPPASVSSDLRIAITPERERGAWVWDLRLGTPLAILHAGTRECTAADVTNDAAQAVTADEDGRVHTWDVARATILGQCDSEHGRLLGIYCWRAGQVVCVHFNGQVVVRTYPDLKPLREHAAGMQLDACVWIGGKSMLATWSRDGEVRCLDLDSGRWLLRRSYTGDLEFLTPSPDGSSVAFVSGTHMENWALDRSTPGDSHTNGPAGSYIAGGRYLLTPGSGLCLWDSDGTLVRQFPLWVAPRTIWCSPDADTLVVATNSGVHVGKCMGATPEVPGREDLVARGLWDPDEGPASSMPNDLARGHAALKAGRYADARTFYQAAGPQAALHHAGVWVAALHEGMQELGQDQPARAKALLRTALDLKPMATTWCYYGHACWLLEQPQEAAAAYDAALEMGFRDAWGRLDIAYRSAAHRPDWTVNLLDKLLAETRLPPGLEDRATLLRGELHLSEGRIGEAMADLRKLRNSLYAPWLYPLIRALVASATGQEDPAQRDSDLREALGLMVKLLAQDDAYVDTVKTAPGLAALRAHAEFEAHWEQAMSLREKMGLKRHEPR